MFAPHTKPTWIALIAAAALLAGCAGKPQAPVQSPLSDPPRPPALVNAIERFQADLGDGFALDFQVERKISKVNNKSCFAFITGRIQNVSGKALSKSSVLDVPVYANGVLLYRDNSRPLADIPAGQGADFEMVVSPVFANGCPAFDKIVPVLRKAYQ